MGLPPLHLPTPLSPLSLLRLLGVPLSPLGLAPLLALCLLPTCTALRLPFSRAATPPPPPPPPPFVDAAPLLLTLLALVLAALLPFLTWWRRQRGGGKGRGGSAAVGLAARAKAAGAKGRTTPERGPMLILWGSQTGTAEGYASTLMREARQRGYVARSVDLEELNPEELCEEQYGPIVFLMATHGEGEPTDNAVGFYEWANDESRTGYALNQVKFCAFGLGNKQYEHYNFMGKWTHRRMIELGAEPILDLGEGDDDENLEDDFEQWRAKLWTKLCPEFSDEVSTPPANFSCTFSDSQPRPTGSAQKSSGRLPIRWLQMLYPKHKVVNSTVKTNRELCSKTTEDSVRHIELDTDCNGLELIYEAADDLGVLCDNGEVLATAAAELLSVSYDASFTLKPLGSGVASPLPTPAKVGDALRFFVDLRAPVSKQLLMLLAEHTSDTTEADRLRHLATDGKQDYAEQILRDGRGLLELLRECPSCKPPWAHLIELVPKLTPRYYTISSASLLDRSTCHLTVKVLREEMRGAPGRTKEGVCSTQLEATTAGASVAAFVRTSTFRLPSISTPVLMVGPGTGVAPFRAFLQQMSASGQRREAETRLYFGCRKESVDFIYKEELYSYLKCGILTKLRLAFSRDGSRKVYVQHQLREDGAEIWPLISKHGAHVYICGGTAMGRDVVAVLQELAQHHGRMSEDHAVKHIKDMHTQGRLVQELWS